MLIILKEYLTFLAFPSIEMLVLFYSLIDLVHKVKQGGPDKPISFCYFLRRSITSGLFRNTEHFHTYPRFPLLGNACFDPISVYIRLYSETFSQHSCHRSLGYLSSSEVNLGKVYTSENPSLLLFRSNIFLFTVIELNFQK